MGAPVTWFEPQVGMGELPARLASPFAPGPPHPLARRAAELLQRRLRERELPGGVDLSALQRAGRGKMFGVLVVAAPGGRVGFLCAFSGMLGERWHVEGFSAPLFDPALRDAFWPAGQEELRALDLRHEALRSGPEPVALRTRLAELESAHAAALAALRSRLEANRRLRHAERERLTSAALEEEALRASLHALARASREDDEERRRLEAGQRREREPVETALRGLEARRAALGALRAERSQALWGQVARSYLITNARGEQTPLATLFAPEPPPGGAGDCAAPKLLADAYRQGLRPVALAEFWWGAPPVTGERQEGAFYPACQSKCGTVLPYMLEGLAVDPAPALAGEGEEAGRVRRVHEDAWLIAVDKPGGLLSVPGRHEPRRDSVLVRLRGEDPALAGLRVVHPLEPETSGLLLLSRDPETHHALQRQFARGEAERRYVAWLEGEVEGDAGVVTLPLGRDEDGVRQRVDPVLGGRAVTGWRVLERGGGRTRVSLIPRTRGLHQLRVHAAEGLGAPIEGDRLYGRGSGARLQLHAEALVFHHPRTGEPMTLVSAAPF